MPMTLIASAKQADERVCLNICMYQEFENNLCLNIKGDFSDQAKMAQKRHLNSVFWLQCLKKRYNSLFVTGIE
jgi:hypothetical protein